jgi:hypothetical protein
MAGTARNAKSRKQGRKQVQQRRLEPRAKHSITAAYWPKKIEKIENRKIEANGEWSAACSAVAARRRLLAGVGRQHSIKSVP